MVKIVWTPEALSDLQHIFDYISFDSTKSATRVVDKIVLRIEKPAAFPNMGRMVPEFQKQELRELVEGSYRLVYLVKDELIEIIRIHHSARTFSL